MAFDPYHRPEGGSNNNSTSRNPRYKGKNYDPNYQVKLRSQQNNNQTFQEYLTQQTGANDSSSQENPFASTSNPLMSSFYKQQQQPNIPNSQTQQSHPQQAQQAQQQQQQQQQQQAQQQLEQLRQQYQQKRQQGQLDLPMQLLARFSQAVGRKLAKDAEGDHRICQCNNPGGTECFHAVSALYQNQLVISGQIQYDIVDLLGFLISKENTAQQGIRIGLSEYLGKNPQTPLRKILETIGREGLVEVGVVSDLS